MREKTKVTTMLLAACLTCQIFAGCSAAGDSQAKSVEAVQTEVAIETVQTEGTMDVVREKMDAADLAEYVQGRTVTITATSKIDDEVYESTGSGFFIDDEGTILTCYHVIDGADSIVVECSNGGKYDIYKVIDFSELYDIAVLKIDIQDNVYLNLADKKTRTGETVYAVGSSLGFLNGTFSNGIVSNAVRSLGMIDCIQTTAAISEGNSGGPLVNEYGEVIGVNAFSYEDGDDLNLAINITALDNLTMDKNWKISQFREWYQKETARSYTVWNYTTNTWETSKINTYQHVTQRECYCSDYDFDAKEDRVKGYYDNYGVYGYEYHVQEFDLYTEYLNSIGFVFVESEEYKNGISYYYENEFNGFKMDIFLEEGEKYVFVEAYSYNE